MTTDKPEILTTNFPIFLFTLGTYATIYIKPVMPGYIMEMGQPSAFKNKPDANAAANAASPATAETDCDNVSWRGSIPCMPRPLAITLCVFNIVVPGLGDVHLLKKSTNHKKR